MNNIEQYLTRGKRLIRLRGPYAKDAAGKTLAKVPIEPPLKTPWCDRIIPATELYAHTSRGGNLAWGLGPTDLVVDVDVRDGKSGCESFEKLQQAFPDTDWDPMVETWSGGFHIYMTIPAGLMIKKDLAADGYPDIDLKTYKGYVLIPGSMVEDDGELKPYEWCEYTDEAGHDIPPSFDQVRASPAFLKLCTRDPNAPRVAPMPAPRPSQAPQYAQGRVGIDLGVITSPDLEYNKQTPDEVRAYLAYLKDFSYQSWLDVGMALHDWDRVEGLKLYHEWSKLSGTLYDPAEIDQVKWPSFSSLNRGIHKKTLGTVVMMAREVMVRAFNTQIIQATDTQVLMHDIADAVRAAPLNPGLREQLAELALQRLGQLTGQTYAIEAIRTVFHPKRSTQPSRQTAQTGLNRFM